MDASSAIATELHWSYHARWTVVNLEPAWDTEYLAKPADGYQLGSHTSFCKASIKLKQFKLFCEENCGSIGKKLIVQ